MIKDNFTRGSKYPGAEYFNAVARASNLAMDLKQSVHNEAAPNNNGLTGQVVIKVENTTGQPLPRLSVLEIDNPLGRGGNAADIQNFVLNQGIIYKGWVPTGGSERTAVITLTALRPGEINKAVIMGIITCPVDVLDVSHRFATPIEDDTTKLESSESGNIRLVLQPSQTGTQMIDVMLGFGGGGEAPAPKNPKVRLVRPKELFPACEYKSLQNVYDCTLEYSDDGTNWTNAIDRNGDDEFDIVNRNVIDWDQSTLPLDPHQYWRVDLSGFSKPEDPNNPQSDRGFATFGRLWEALFWVQRYIETSKNVTRRIAIDTLEMTEYTFTAEVPDNWNINQKDPLAVNLSITPELSNGELFYAPNTSHEWQSLGAFTSQAQVMIPAEDLMITVDEETGKERHNTSFLFRVKTIVEDHRFETVQQYNAETDSIEEVVVETIVYVEKEAGNLTLSRPTYKLSPERPTSFTLTERPVAAMANDCTLTAKVTSLVNGKNVQVSVNVALTPPLNGAALCYRSEMGTWQNTGAIYDKQTFTIPADDLENQENTFFEFGILQYGQDIVVVSIPKPKYPISQDSADVALPPPREDVDVAYSYFDSKPTPRKSQNLRYWTLKFNQPEIVTKIMLDVDRHFEHYIVCPGGRDASKQDVPFIYSLDLASEKWTATTFPQLATPMYNMDAKVIELLDKTHQLIILSGHCKSGDADFLQGYNFEKDYLNNTVNMAKHKVNFAGRPALSGDPMIRGTVINDLNKPAGESDFSRSLIVVGGAENSTVIDYPPTGSTSTSETSLFFVSGANLEFGKAYSRAWSTNSTTGSNANTAPAIETEVKNQKQYSRKQDLPVRGILRRRQTTGTLTQTSSSSNRVVDFILIGGFNPTSAGQNNKTVVSGMFGASSGTSYVGASMYAQGVTYSGNNSEHFITYRDCPRILGDCCAEYYRDENGIEKVLCFGGRAKEENGVLPHDEIAVLTFDQSGNDATWSFITDPALRMPHPRWSAASVLIKGLVRKGESEPCDRIFFIGGCKQKGEFVPEVDVLNLRYYQWETDWKGLDQGELETIPASLAVGGGTIIIQGGGSSSSGIQSVKAGDGIKITGDSKNPIVAAPGGVWG